MYENTPYKVFRYCPLRISIITVIIKIIKYIIYSASCVQNKIQTFMAEERGGERNLHDYDLEDGGGCIIRYIK